MGFGFLDNRDLRGSRSSRHHQAIVRRRLGLLDRLEGSSMVAGDYRLCHDHHSISSPIYSVGGVAISNRRHLHLSMLFHGGLGGPLFPVACRPELSAEKAYLGVGDRESTPLESTHPII